MGWTGAIREFTGAMKCDQSWMIGFPDRFEEAKEAHLGYKGWTILRRDDHITDTTREALLDLENKLQSYMVAKWRAPAHEFIVWTKHFEHELGLASSNKYEDESSESYVEYSWQWPSVNEFVKGIKLTIRYHSGSTTTHNGHSVRTAPQTLLILEREGVEENVPEGIFEKASLVRGRK